MKKYLLSLILMLSIAPAFAKMSQSKYRWRNDNGSETAATWKAPENTPIVLSDMAEILRLRLEFNNVASDGWDSEVNRALSYSKDGGGTWTEITESDLNDFKLVTSAYVTHGDVTTNVLGTSTGGTFTSGRIFSQMTPDYSYLFTTGLRTESEWVIQPTILCENFTNYRFEMRFWEASAVSAELTTNFDCEEPIIEFESTELTRCGPGTFTIDGTIDAEDGIIRYWTELEGGDLVGTGTTFITPSYSSSTTIYAEGFGAGCYSERVPIELTVYELPTINITESDGVYCALNGIFTLHTSPAQPETNTILWSTGATTPTIDLSTTSGTPITVWVTVTTENGCIDTDTIILTVNPSPVVDLGADTSVCEGGVVVLDAGNPGHSYYWNNGLLTRTIEVESDGMYSVIVTNSFGCMAMDTIDVNVEGFAPSIDGIIVDNLGAKAFQFTAYNPLNVASYKWDFGDDNTSVTPNPIHFYDTVGTYTVTLEVSSTCGKKQYFTYATVVLGVDAVDLANKHLKVYPIPAQNVLHVQTINSVKMENIQVFDMTGALIISMPMINTSETQIDLSKLPSGMYQLKVDSKEGMMVNKFQVIR